MKNHLKVRPQARRRQGHLLAFGLTGAMALAVTACNNSGATGPPMILPPGSFNTSEASSFYGTNQPPNSPYVYDGAGGGHSTFLTGIGYYPIYGYPNYYYRPAPGSTVELVTGASSGYVAGSPAEAQESVDRGGFGGGEEGGHGGE